MIAVKLKPIDKTNSSFKSNDGYSEILEKMEERKSKKVVAEHISL